MREALEDRAEGEEAGVFLAGGTTFGWSGDPEARARHAAGVREALES